VEVCPAAYLFGLLCELVAELRVVELAIFLLASFLLLFSFGIFC